ncbi:isoflavone reductase family [Lecanosticta acicola]|uniref:Isoflavone reductase family n=1 Tax=Lecanosticta acicola TaxID=111012 RepID=A0AAI8Z497_9PEZI|nr:isoflavone reductase family [Lecanosticta acicola]
MPRLNHKKARTGCQRCKQRKVKCDEVKPRCSACSRHNVTCEYVEPAPRKSDALAVQHASPDVYSALREDGTHILDPRLELKLMHEWTAYTCASFSTELDFWRFQAPLFAMEHRLVLDAMFGLAALYFSRRSSTQWIPMAGRMVPIRDPGHGPLQASPEVVAANGANAVDLAATADAAAFVDAGASQEMLINARKYFDRAIDGHQRAVQNLSRDNIEAVYITSILISFHALFTLGEHEGDSTLPSLDPLFWLRLADGTRYLCEVWRGFAGDEWIENNAVYFGRVKLAEEDALFQQEQGKPFQQLLTFAEDYESSNPDDKDAYQKAVAYLAFVHKSISQNTDDALVNCRRLVAMPSRLPKRFNELIEVRQPRAVVILAHAFATMKLISDKVPWFRTIAERQIPSIYQVLPAGWRELMSWPMKVAEGKIAQGTEEADIRDILSLFSLFSILSLTFMAVTNGVSGARDRIAKVLVLGDNRLAESIVHSLSHSKLEVHQSTHPQSTLEQPHGIKIHKIASSPEALAALFHALQPDLIVSTQAPGSFSTQKLYVDTAVSNLIHTPRFVLPEFAQDSLNTKIQERLPPYRERAKTIAYLRSLSAEGKIEWVGIATGCDLSHALRSGNLGFDFKWQSASLHGTGDEVFAAATSSTWNGLVALQVTKHWHELKNQYLYASNLLTSTNAILRGLQETSKSPSKWEANYSPEISDLLHEAERRFERGFPDAGMFLMERAVLFDPTLDAVKPFVERDAKAILGLLAEGSCDDEKLADVVKKVVRESQENGQADCGCS